MISHGTVTEGKISCASYQKKRLSCGEDVYYDDDDAKGEGRSGRSAVAGLADEGIAGG